MFDMTTDDAIQAYTDTYIGIRHDDHIQPFYIDKVASGEQEYNDYKFRVYKVSKQGVLGNHLYIKKDKADDIVKGIPHSQSINASNYNLAVRVTRWPKKQWKKTLSHRILNVNVIATDEAVLLGAGKGHFIDHGKVERLSHIVWDLFNPTYLTAGNALHKLRKGNSTSVAISENFVLRLHKGWPTIVLQYKDVLAGVVNNKDKILLPKEFHHLYEELTEVAEAERA